MDVSPGAVTTSLVIEPTLVQRTSVTRFGIAREASRELFLSLALWLFSVLVIAVLPAIVALPYIIIHYRGATNVGQALASDPTVLLLSVIGVFPAHAATFWVAWSLVTRRGTRPFWRSIGWSFSPKFGLLWCAGLSIVLWFLGTIITKLIGGGPTDVDVLVNSTLAVRLLLAIVASTSGPLVEEIVYRGVIYPVLEKTIGMAWAVALVSFLFASVHLYQYRNNGGVIAVIVMLSVTLTLVRAFTGRLLPCFIIHMGFNGIVSVLIVFQPYFAQFDKGGAPKAGMVMLWRMIRLLT